MECPTSSAPFDLIVRYFVERGVYDLFLINDALYDFGQPQYWLHDTKSWGGKYKKSPLAEEITLPAKRD
jgi:hypothetical protein